MPIAEPISVPTNAPYPNRYGAMCTEVYDLDKPPGSLPDVPFYLERLIGTEGPILEAGVGDQVLRSHAGDRGGEEEHESLSLHYPQALLSASAKVAVILWRLRRRYSAMAFECS